MSLPRCPAVGRRANALSAMQMGGNGGPRLRGSRAFAHTTRSAICHPPNTRNHWLQHAAANEREADFSRSKWSNEGARHNLTQGSTPEGRKEGAQLRLHRPAIGGP